MNKQTPHWLVGIACILASVGLSSASAITSTSITPGSSTGFAIGMYAFALLLRVLFLKLSGRILTLGKNTWGSALATVGINSMILLGLTFLAQALGLHGVLVIAGVLTASTLVAFFVAMKTYRVTFLEALSLYVLTFALFAVAFLVLTFVFHASLETALSVPGVQ